MTGITTARYSEPWLLWILAAYAGTRGVELAKAVSDRAPVEADT
jgi:hypothetical protein